MLYHVGDSHILKISKSIKLLVKKENVSFVEKAIGTFGATQYVYTYTQNFLKIKRK